MMNSYIFTLLLLPFIGSVITFIVGKLHKSLTFISAYIISFVLFAISIYLFINYTNPYDISIDWFRFGSTTLPFGIYIDKLSLVMLLIATGLGLLDIHFSHDYMKYEKDHPRYYAKMLFFVGGMLILVSTKELLGLFVGWEFMGVASYLLISFWHTKKDPADAGVAAFLYTKFGDIFLFASIGILFYFTGTLDIQAINAMAISGEIPKDVLYIVAIFIFIAAIGKSGQFPLFPWLMRAMEGPTTVSALIHGATMVNSGIYIVARMFDFYLASDTLIIVASIAAISAFIGASSALVQTEIKKVLAYSTMSHLSLAFIGLGAGSLAAGMTHLVNHAIFKALLFLGAGAVILASHHTKDMWRLGGLGKKLFFIAIFMAFGVLSLSGIPPFSGYYSKDMIIATTLTNPQTFGLISTLTLLSGVLSIAYAGRMWVLLFVSDVKDKKVYENTKTPSFFWIALPLGIMAIITLILGFYQEELAFYITGTNTQELHISWLVPLMMILILFLAFLVYYFYYKRQDLLLKVSAQPLMKTIHQVLFNGYYVEKLITWIAKSIIIEVIAKTINWIDRNIIDAFINGFITFTKKISKLFSLTHSSVVSNQIGSMVVGLVFIIITIIIGGIL